MISVPIESAYATSYLSPIVTIYMYGPILHRFWDTATYWPKLPIFLLLSHSAPLLSTFPLEYRGKVNRQETRVMGLSYCEDRMIVA